MSIITNAINAGDRSHRKAKRRSVNYYRRGYSLRRSRLREGGGRRQRPPAQAKKVPPTRSATRPRRISRTRDDEGKDPTFLVCNCGASHCPRRQRASDPAATRDRHHRSTGLAYPQSTTKQMSILCTFVFKTRHSSSTRPDAHRICSPTESVVSLFAAYFLI